MAPSVRYNCPCFSSSPLPPPPHLASSSYNFHPLHALFFCEECDAVRCNKCVAVEVSCYYCPNCLFEVPSASVRAEKNRCARNCFSCPNCRNTLSVVASDPPDTDDGPLSSIPSGTIGEPPFFLYCNHCRWDSAEVGITFEKPTGLAAQLQKFEDSAPDALEFDRLKEHFEPLLQRAASSLPPPQSISRHASHSSSVTAAAASALARDVTGTASKYSAHPLARSRSSKDRSLNKDEMPEYRARVDIASASVLGAGGGEADAEYIRHLENIGQVATLEQRWVTSWTTPLHVADLRPLRIPLQSKKTKRCSTCRHILIKPEQKAQSVRYKIKLVAANYLPAITASVPVLNRVEPTRRPGAAADAESTTGMQAGKTYPFQLALTNPLYDPIQVRLSVQRAGPSASANTPGTTTDAAATRRPPFAVSLPNSAFPIAAFAEAWEYEDDEDMLLDDDDLTLGVGHHRGGRDGGGSKLKSVGVLEKKANTTVVGGEVVIGRSARGEVKFNMLVSYTYRSDDTAGSEDHEATPSRRQKQQQEPEMKTFSFSTVVDLGPIIAKETQELES
ncbi:dynactin p62 [Punctularia strigosozonata HHB-11173 SS5]|uniref:dynactin p62 n=1 Tax=Punctularia strigosozonata (strain HHB-11173) TaxID=741275 RepID=UPI00044163F0|nr:dynactin p62 [Punctularia strigosozonata HHB-11173 SS5]EIN12571.1 dynactin p62 [Punctularia strigosozonata HHB-11173 SS5]